MSNISDQPTTAPLLNGSCEKTGGKANSEARIFAPSDDEEICITGLAGRFPSCHNVAEFEYNLYNKVSPRSQMVNIVVKNDFSFERNTFVKY